VDIPTKTGEYLDINIKLTKHANDKRNIEGISIEQIKECIKRGSKYKQTDGLLSKYGYINVAYKIIRGKYLIKTVFVDK